MNTKYDYDVIIIGAGHAGLEAAFATNKQRLKTALITLQENSVALMPCNPSIGGPAKGIVTREIDCLGGMQAIAADECQLQMKLLNSSKGPGVWALRAQVDKIKYHKWFLNELKKSNIDLIIDEVIDIKVNDQTFDHVVLKSNKTLSAKYLIVTTGTYLKSLTFKGDDIKNEGPDGLNNANKLSDALKTMGFKLIRLKTGTPPRIDKNSIDYTDLTIEPGTNQKLCFSHFQKTYLPFDKQIPCYIVHTNAMTHKIINQNLKRSAMYGGMINAIGPRYCPSIEDKIVKFADKPKHQIFYEPESLELDSIYLGGFSTSMPIDVQDQMIRTLPGLKKCKILKYAYAIEYDAIDPLQLYKTLESKKIKNLFFAGQINGTSGYEEAAAQGLIAALNVCNKFYNRKPLILHRDEAYIGVMIDDITTKGILEPYRLLTSRAEYRLSLRNDNCEDRLLKIGYENGMISFGQYNQYLQRKKIIDEIIDFLKNKTTGMYINQLNFDIKKTNQTLYDFLKRQDVDFFKLLSSIKDIPHQSIDEEMITKINILVKFDGYIKKQEEDLQKMNNLKIYELAHIDDYKQIPNLSLEAIDKLNMIKPFDLDQASRISGININDIMVIKLYLDTHIKKDHKC